MALLGTKVALETYFINNWTETQIQYEGVPFDYDTLTEWVSLKFVPQQNNSYGFDGSSTGRINYNAQLQVFVYAKQVPLCYALADEILSFLNGVNVGGNVETSVGQVQGSAIQLDNGWYEQMITFDVNNYN